MGGSGKRSIPDLAARSELALKQGWFQKAGEMTPTAAYDHILASTGDEELAKSCRFAAVLHRDYGSDVAQLVELVYLRTKEATKVATHFGRGVYLEVTTTGLEPFTPFVRDDSPSYAVSAKHQGFVVGEDGRFLHLIYNGGWISVNLDEIIWAANPATTQITAEQIVEHLLGVAHYLPQGWSVAERGCLDEEGIPVLDFNLILQKLWEGYQTSIEQ